MKLTQAQREAAAARREAAQAHHQRGEQVLKRMYPSAAQAQVQKTKTVAPSVNWARGAADSVRYVRALAERKPR